MKEILERNFMNINNRNKYLFVILVVSILLAGCKNQKQEPVLDPVSVNSVSQESTTSQTVENVVEPTEEVTLSENLVRSELSNEWISASSQGQRPIAVMINNIINAIPQSGISKAGVIYECPVEGNLTRLMAVFDDWEELDKIGPVRSARDYFVYWVYEWDAIYCHFGGPKLYVDALLSRDVTNNLDGTSLDGTVYYRTKDRVAPHNAYVSGEGILKGLELKKYQAEHTDNYQGNHFTFALEDSPVDLTAIAGSFDATTIKPGYPINKPYFEYHLDTGLYHRYQYGKEHIDDLTNQQLTFKNVIFQKTYHEVRDANGYLSFQDHDSTRDGYYFTNGKGIHIRWKKESDFGATKYYDDNNNEVILNTGKTMICIIPDQKASDIVIEP